ncbi:DNA-3-methyladenine glycosylase [Amylibacter kogurei]|uniref:DNA-3-methyladenine glycosylase I n=1 Tax=Paramylibacter kogurei TaxID=1889778 RepID=A0A2G5K2T2_9RHOB|nr:DNA-3-methyladenine glycosylase I [Amylibacter kogurei]PIB23230.1 DNA-3-methyladenine glycosylase [Amylibacter kogurei]
MNERCEWCGTDPIYVKYHDEEWGVPEYDGRALWEKLVLDGFQAGLSWITILKKRDAFRDGFNGFDPNQVAEFGENDIQRLLKNEGIVRHRGKIEAAIKGARAWQSIESDIGFSSYLWNFVDGRPIQNQFHLREQVPTQTPLSVMISKDLKKRGFNFCGPTIVYAFMEACGLVNDHQTTCPRHADVQKLAR